jgi:hypothetical protein
VHWSTFDRLDFSVPLAQKNVSSFSVVSFRIGKVVESAADPPGGGLNVHIGLRDGAGRERAVSVRSFAAIPYPDPHPNPSLSKSAMKTARVPLASFTMAVPVQSPVDLADIVTVFFLSAPAVGSTTTSTTSSSPTDTTVPRASRKRGTMIDSERLRSQAKEVVRVIDRKPHLLSRIDIDGAVFPQRAVPPFVRIRVNDELTVSAWFASVSNDGRTLSGYFQEDLPARGAIEFGYGVDVMGRLPLPFDAGTVLRLDRKKLPQGIVIVSRDFLKKKLRR